MIWTCGWKSRAFLDRHCSVPAILKRTNCLLSLGTSCSGECKKQGRQLPKMGNRNWQRCTKYPEEVGMDFLGIEAPHPSPRSSKLLKGRTIYPSISLVETRWSLSTRRRLENSIASGWRSSTAYSMAWKTQRVEIILWKVPTCVFLKICWNSKRYDSKVVEEIAESVVITEEGENKLSF